MGLPPDSAEALLEFNTPVDGDIGAYKADLYARCPRHTARRLATSGCRPLARRYASSPASSAELAQYGTSNVGRPVHAISRGAEEPLWRADADYLRAPHPPTGMAFGRQNVVWRMPRVVRGRLCAISGSIRNYYRFGRVIPIRLAPAGDGSHSCKAKTDNVALEKRATACGLPQRHLVAPSATLVIPISRKAISELRLTICNRACGRIEAGD